MRTIQAALLAALLLPTMALAQTRVGVIDPLEAISATEEARTRLGQLKADIKDDEQALAALRQDIASIEQKLKRDGATMTAAQQKELKQDLEAKVRSFREQQQQAQQEIGRIQKDLLADLQPKYQTALEAVIKEKRLDLVITRGAVEYAGKDADITELVTKKINQMK